MSMMVMNDLRLKDLTDKLSDFYDELVDDILYLSGVKAEFDEDRIVIRYDDMGLLDRHLLYDKIEKATFNFFDKDDLNKENLLYIDCEDDECNEYMQIAIFG